MKTLKTFLFILSLLCSVAVEAQVGVTALESLWTIKKDNNTGKLALYTAKGEKIPRVIFEPKMKEVRCLGR